MKKIVSLFCVFAVPLLSACDLNPKIVNLPGSIDEFITNRYPALLADPNTESEIYNSAAYDYGVYASPSLYGAYGSDTSDYVLYANVSDYVMPEQNIDEETVNVVADVEGDFLVVGMYGGDVQRDVNIQSVPAVSRVPVRVVTVNAGDTLYSLSRKYEVPVNDLAVMNDLDAPFALSVGQQIKVPDLQTATSPVAVPVKQVANDTGAKPEENQSVTNQVDSNADNSTAPAKPVVQKISSDPAKKLPAISGRSSSLFSWPVRGHIVSEYGAKSNGLFNDGINIAASRGTTISAAENGVVAYAGNEVKGMGNLVIIQHTDGWMTVYGHMDAMSVKRGTKVAVGQKIGTVGNTGKVDEPQLHFEIRKGTKAYNPTEYLKK